MKRLALPLAAFFLFGPGRTAVLAQTHAEVSPADAIRQRMEASVTRQLNSIGAMNNASARTRNAAEHHQKIAASGFFDLPALPVLPQISVPACDSLPPAKIDSLINSAAAATTVDPGLIREVMKEESAGNPCAVSTKGAMGLMQLMPTTAAEFGVQDAFAPEDNVLAGAKLLRQLIDHYSGNLSLVLSAYNAGQGAVDATMTVPDFPETTDYVHEILSRLLPGPDLTRPQMDEGFAFEADSESEPASRGAATIANPDGSH